MKIIALSGVDGSGKSTQRTLLQEHFDSLGYRLAYFHATEFSSANRLKRSKKEVFRPGVEPAVTQANFVQVLARIFFLFIDGLRFTSYAHCLERSGVNVLVSDRFFQDSLINICYLSKNPLIRILVKILANVLPVPEHTFYLKVAVPDIEKRERVPEQGSTYLKEKIKLYDHPPFSWIHQTIDATQTPGTVHQYIVARLANV